MTQKQLDYAQRNISTVRGLLKFIADTDNLQIAEHLYFVRDKDRWLEVSKSTMV